MSLNFANVRTLLRDFDFKKLFVEELGWSPPSLKKTTDFDVKGVAFTRKQIAELAGVAVFEVQSDSGNIPDAKIRATIQKAIAQEHHENVLVFLDKPRSQSLWYWAKRDGGKTLPREHLYAKGQPGDLFISKLGQMCFDLSDFDGEGNVPIVEVAKRIQDALDVEPVTKKFYKEYQQQHLAFIELIEGVANDQQRRWYASVLLNRLMFIWFLQRKGFIDGGNLNYLLEKLEASKKKGKDLFFNDFLKVLFFEGFAKPEKDRSTEARKLLGSIKYLNGGLFLPHTVEQHNPKLHVPDKAFENLFGLFKSFSWNLNDTLGGEDDELNPDVLGYIFEKYINQKAFGAYYTRPEITEYLCERTIHQLILDAVDKAYPGKFSDIGEVLMNLDALLCKRLLMDVLPNLSLLDPACGSGAFLVAAMKVLIDIYSAIVGRIPFIKSGELKLWLDNVQSEHKSTHYFIKKRIITDNLYGVDIMDEATEIARLRLFLALVAAADHVDQLEPLPNIDFNILPGNSLIGLLHVDASKFEEQGSTTGPQEKLKLVSEGGKGDLPGMTFESPTGPTQKELEVEFAKKLRTKRFGQILTEKNRLIEIYRHAATYGEDLTRLRDEITAHRAEAVPRLDKLLLGEFQTLGVKFEQATRDTAKNKEGRAVKRALNVDDIHALRPFHWGFEFDEILNRRGGFDAIITNPPWEIFKPNSKEFFLEYSDLITRKKMSIHDFEEQQAELLKDKEILTAWLDYLSQFPHLSAYYRSAEQYKNQISVVNGKKSGTDINLYKLFAEQCFNLLRPGGLCGIVIPSGIYTDLGTKQLREMLFAQTEVTGLFGFENRKEIFENVDSRFKFVVLTYRRGGTTTEFPAAFMRHHVAELEHFPRQGALPISVELVRRLSPDSLSIMEFKNELDIHIAKKMLTFPLLGERIERKWNVRFTREFDMTNDSHLFKTEPGPDCLPLYEGKMIWHFDPNFAQPRYWVQEKVGRQAVLGRSLDRGESLDYQTYRLGFRDIASNTNERTLIAALIPPAFHGNKIPTVCVFKDGIRSISNSQLLFLCANWCSYVLDFIMRMKITTTLNFFYMLQLPVPRLAESDPLFTPIVERAARLTCITPDFDDLAKEVGLGDRKKGATRPAERAQLRAELDGLIAHLYGLTEHEFAYILTTFPLVEQGVKDAALDAYRAFAPKTEDEEAAVLAKTGEKARVEFKSTARWDLNQSKANPVLERVIVEEAAAFLNSDGGTLLIGVADDGTPLGLANDYQVFNKRKDPDAYENWLTQLLLNDFGKDCAPLLSVTFPSINGTQICRLDLKPAPRPIYLKSGSDEHPYIRAGNSKKRLSTREAVEYIKQRWK